MQQNEFKIFVVGGSVRDELIGREASDIDYAIEAPTFNEMKSFILDHSKQIFLERPEYGIIRYLSTEGVPEDMSLCAKVRDSSGRILEVGSIEEDLKTRDFTMNALARAKIGNQLIDPFDGKVDIKNKIIRCVTNPRDTFQNDPARILRAIRFKVQFDFSYDEELSEYMHGVHDFALLKQVDLERLRQEMDKCLKVSTLKTLEELSKLNRHCRTILFQHHGIELKAR